MGGEIARRYGDGEQWDKIADALGLTSMQTIFEWEDKHPAFADALSRARNRHAEALVVQAMNIAQAERDPQRARVMIETRKWAASKFNQRFADRVELSVDHKLSLGTALQAAQARLVRPVSDQQLIEDVEYEALPHVQPITSTDGASDEAADAPDLPDFFD